MTPLPPPSTPAGAGHLRALRRRVFARRRPADAELMRLARDVPGHGFLTNPAIVGIYGYLTDFVVAACAQHFGRPGAAGLRLLDWGAGKGHISHLLRQAAPEAQLSACDIAAGLDDKGHSTFQQDTPIADASGVEITALDHPWRLPFADGAFDATLSMGVLEHVPHETDSLRELWRITRPGGLFFCFFLPQTLSWTQRIEHLRGNTYHDRLYGRSATITQLRSAGFDVVQAWRRQLLPKNKVRYPLPRLVETLDQKLTEHTPLGLFATNLELVAVRGPQ